MNTFDSKLDESFSTAEAFSATPEASPENPASFSEKEDQKSFAEKKEMFSAFQSFAGNAAFEDKQKSFSEKKEMFSAFQSFASDASFEADFEAE